MLFTLFKRTKSFRNIQNQLGHKTLQEELSVSKAYVKILLVANQQNRGDNKTIGRVRFVIFSFDDIERQSDTKPNFHFGPD